MIPMSSRVDKFQTIINKRRALGKPCDTLHICKLDNGKMNVFLLQDMFPIIEDYIIAEYTIADHQLMLTSDKEAKVVLVKARRTLNMIHRGIKFNPTQPNVLAIEEVLLNR